MFRIILLQGIVGIILHMLRVPPLREKERDSLQTNNKGPKIRRSEHGKSHQLYFQIEEEIFLCPPLETKERTSYQEVIDSLTYKARMDAIRNEMGTLVRNKV